MTARLSPEKQNAQDMYDARAQSQVHIARLRAFIHGGNDNWEEHSKLVRVLSHDPVFDKSKRVYMGRSERYKNALRVSHRMHELLDQQKWSYAVAGRIAALMEEPTFLTLHLAAFEPVFISQASPELLAKYKDLVENRGILGCYLQTELAHGTNVQCLETTATYLPRTSEFEIHSPTLTSSKWWIGGLGKTATHGVVQAKLILPDGTDAGPHLFFVQLRSLDDHKVLPGIILGDIGPKALQGNIANDNGFARFDHVRIPASHMLSKFAQVTEDGRYVIPPHAKLSYGGMLYIRSTMVGASGWSIAKAATIAIRYATVRRQGTKGTNGLENQIIKYPSVYIRLLPILARAYTFILLGRNLGEAFAGMSSRLAAGDTSLVAEMHATTSGLKVLVTTATISDLETARRALGGHGYSAFAGIGSIYADQVPSATFEGDNYVLDQQVVRAALKAFGRASSAKPSEAVFSPTTSYLRLLFEQDVTSFSWEDSNAVIRLLEQRALKVVRNHASHLQDLDASANQRLSRAVMDSFVASQAGEFIKLCQSTLSTKESVVVTSLLHLYLLTTVESALVDILSLDVSGASSSPEEFTRSLRKTIQALCQKLLPEAVGLTDAFGFSDWELDSALGVYDGRVYEALWDRVQTEPLNQREVPDGYQEYIRPVLERGQRMAAVRHGAKL